MTRPIRSLVSGGLALAVVTLVAACSGGPGSSGPPSTGSPAPSPSAVTTVDGTTYISTAVTGATLAPGSQVRLTFKDGHLTANAGCNTMAGSYTITNGRLATTQMATTEMACPGPLMTQDQWVAGLLSGADVTLAGDTLTLDNGTIKLTLQDRKVAEPDKPLEGTHWILEGIRTGDAVSSVPAGVTASIDIANGQISVNAGCNGGSGTVTVAPDTLTIGPLMMTKKACTAGPAAVEAAVTQVLTGTVPYTIDADVLTLDAGGTGLTYRAAPPTP